VPEGGNQRSNAYWRSNLRLLLVLLSIWAFAAFGLGIVLVEPLNAFRIGGFPVGFWFAHQGSILIFIALILVYALSMDRIERRMQRGGK
jgi:putative solute:sodium symporter small subunit